VPLKDAYPLDLPDTLPPGTAVPFGRPSWSGLLQFSLIGIPLKAYPAVRLERQLGAGPSVAELDKMPDAEFFRLVGLPAKPTPQQIAGVIAEIETDLARTITGYRKSR
jgi:hypothetical protein